MQEVEYDDKVRQPTFVLYNSGKARVVSREEWESSWLSWWKSFKS